jgi:hypothetical protein
LVLTQLTQVFGVRGDGGDLMIEPKLVKEEFGADGTAGVRCGFAGKNLHVIFRNASKADIGRYTASRAVLNGRTVAFSACGDGLRIDRRLISRAGKSLRLEIELTVKN